MLERKGRRGEWKYLVTRGLLALVLRKHSIFCNRSSVGVGHDEGENELEGWRKDWDELYEPRDVVLNFLLEG